MGLAFMNKTQENTYNEEQIKGNQISIFGKELNNTENRGNKKNLSLFFYVGLEVFCQQYLV